MNHEYAAAFFDADGCFTMDNGTPKLAVSQVDLHILVDYRRLYGGSVYGHDKKTKTSRRSFRWVCCGEDALAAVRAMLPYLRGKRTQALALLEHRSYPPRSAMREVIKARLKRLKKVEYTHDDIQRITDATNRCGHSDLQDHLGQRGGDQMAGEPLDPPL